MHFQIIAFSVLSGLLATFSIIILCCPWGLLYRINSSINAENSQLWSAEVCPFYWSQDSLLGRKMWLDHKPFWLDCLPHSSVSSMERLFPWGYHYSTHLSVTLKLWCTPLSWNVELQAVPFAACFIFISLSYVIKCPPKVNTDRKELLFLFVYHNIRHIASNWSIFLEQMNECTHQITDHPNFQCTLKGMYIKKKKR